MSIYSSLHDSAQLYANELNKESHPFSMMDNEYFFLINKEEYSLTPEVAIQSMRISEHTLMGVVSLSALDVVVEGIDQMVNNIKNHLNIKKYYVGLWMVTVHRSPYSNDFEINVAFRGKSIDRAMNALEFNNKLEEILGE